MNDPAFTARIVVVAPIAVRYDAISNAARNTYFMLKDQPGLDVAFITSHNEFPEVTARVVSGVSELLLDPTFRAADLIIYSFGIFHPFLDALLVGNGHAKQVVHFHNITPAALVKESDRPLIERSFRQLHNLRHANQIWAVSRTNAAVLIEHGINPARVGVLPLAVDRPHLAFLQDKPADNIELLFVGRGVAAKGLLDGLTALGNSVAAGVPPVRLSVVCNMAFSDEGYIAQCRHAVVQLGLQDTVTFCGTVDDVALGSLYRKAHALLIPSYHEGFCVPVIEALRAGCIPIGYTAGNMPDILAGLGCLAPVGDIETLGTSLTRLLVGLGGGLGSPSALVLPLDRGMMSVSQFDRMAQEYVQDYTLERVARKTLERVRALVQTEKAAVTFQFRSLFSNQTMEEFLKRSQLTDVPPSLFETFEFPPQDFIEWVRRLPRMPFDGAGPTTNHKKEVSFIATQIHRHWVSVRTVLPLLGPSSVFVDLGSFPFGIPLALRRYAGYEGRILATAISTLTDAGRSILDDLKVQIASVDLDPHVVTDSNKASATIPLESQSVDVVMLNHVIEHLYHPMNVLSEARRVLKPDGALVVITDNSMQLRIFMNLVGGAEFLSEPVGGTAAMTIHDWRGHVRFFSATDLMTMCKAAGFSDFSVAFKEFFYDVFLEEAFYQHLPRLPGFHLDVVARVPQLRNDIVLVASLGRSIHTP